MLPNVPHLVGQRGNRGEKLFPAAGDRKLYLQILSENLKSCHVKLWAYRLESSEVMLLLLPQDLQGMARCLRNAHGLYSQTINRRSSATGHLFQGRFYSCPLDPEYAMEALRHLDRAGGAASSSHDCRLHRLGQAPAGHADECSLCDIVDANIPYPNSAADLAQWVSRSADPAIVRAILGRLRVGKPAGSPNFVKQVELLTGLNLSRRRGRPRKIVVPQEPTVEPTPAELTPAAQKPAGTSIDNSSSTKPRPVVAPGATTGRGFFWDISRSRSATRTERFGPC